MNERLLHYIQQRYNEYKIAEKKADKYVVREAKELFGWDLKIK